MSTYKQIIEISKMCINGWKDIHLSTNSLFDDAAKEKLSQKLIAHIKEQKNVLSADKYNDYLRELRRYINQEGFYPSQAAVKLGGMLVATVKECPEFQQLDAALADEIANDPAQLSDEKSHSFSTMSALSSAIKWGFLLFAPVGVGAARLAAREKESSPSPDQCFSLTNTPVFERGHGPLTPYFRDIPQFKNKNRVCLSDIPSSEHAIFLGTLKYIQQFKYLELFSAVMLNADPAQLKGMITEAENRLQRKEPAISEINSALEAFIQLAAVHSHKSAFDNLIANSLQATGAEPDELITNAQEGGFIRTAQLLRRVFGEQIAVSATPTINIAQFRAR